MKKQIRWILISILALFFTVFVAGSTYAAEAGKTIGSVVIENYQVDTDDEVSDFDEGEAEDIIEGDESDAEIDIDTDTDMDTEMEPEEDMEMDPDMDTNVDTGDDTEE